MNCFLKLYILKILLYNIHYIFKNSEKSAQEWHLCDFVNVDEFVVEMMVGIRGRRSFD